jgi:hypothetical protein
MTSAKPEPHSAFGLTLDSELELPWPSSSAAGGARPVEIALVDRDTLARAWSGTETGPTWDTTFPGGRRVTVERGRAGDQLIRYADRAYFALSPDASRIACHAVDPADASWRRFLLDTVLWWTALARGLDVLHAGAVDLGDGAVGVVSASGGGKSTLTAELLLRGAQLVADDVMALEGGRPPRVHPGPPLMNLAAARTDLHSLGRVLARLDEGDDELWVAVDRPASEPVPLRALFLYRRGAGLTLGVRRAAPTMLDLAPHAWGIPDDAAGARRRFAVLGEIADSVAVFELTAGLDAPPQAIADRLTTALA